MKIVISTTIKGHKTLELIEQAAKDATDARNQIDKIKTDGGLWLDHRVIGVSGDLIVTHHNTWIPYHTIQCISYQLN